MDRLYLGGPNDAEVDALLSQLNDESILKLKVNTHKSASTYGFEYPSFTDGWTNDDDDDLDNQLASRFSSLKLPINSTKKRGKDSSPNSRRGSNSDRVGKKGKDYVVMGKKRRDPHAGGRRGRNLEVVGEEEENETEECPENSSKSSSRIEDGSSSRHQRQKAPTSTSLPQATQVPSTKSLNNLEAAATINGDEDLDKIDAQLHERFRALKASPAPPPATSIANRNVGLENLMQFAGQQRSSSSNNDYESYGSTLSTPSSPSAKLLGRSTSRSSPSPRVLTTSVSSSCRCSAPSPLKLLKQVSSKTFPSKQQLPAPAPSPPPGGNDSTSVTPGKEAWKDDNRTKGSGTSKPSGKDNEKCKKEKKEKKEHNSNEDSSPSTVKDVKRLLSSVADRVGLERNRVSSADEEIFLGDDLHYWTVLDGEEDFARVSTEEQDLDREAEKVVEWAKDATRLEMGDSDLESETEEFHPGVNKDEDEDTSGGSDLSEGSISSKVKSGKKGVKATPKKKKWGLF